MPVLKQSTRLNELPPSFFFQLRRLFDPDKQWQQLAVAITNKKGNPKYSQLDVKNFEFELEKGNSPTEALIRDWSYDNVSVENLLKALIACQRYDALEWIVVKEMKKMTVERFQEMCDKEDFGDLFNKKTDGAEMPLRDHVKAVENCTPLGTVSAQCDHFDSYVSGAEVGDAGYVYGGNNPSDTTEQETHVIDGRLNEETPSETPQFSYEHLSVLTKNWNGVSVSDGGRVLGHGGYATVFLGKPPNHPWMAVKRLEHKDEAHKQFMQEVQALVMFAHPNIVPLFGISQDGPHWCIVYENMENGSLHDRLFCKDNTPPLTSTQRCRITQGIAQGLNYLHTKNETPFIHRDVKPENVLLDRELTAKLGDCGLARRGPTDPTKSHTITRAIIGTECYCAPEYLRGEISVKLDAFSFGMVLYQILTGQLASDDRRQEMLLNEHVDQTFATMGDSAIRCLVDLKMVTWDKENLEPVFDMARRLTTLSKYQRPRVQDVLPEIMEWPQDW